MQTAPHGAAPAPDITDFQTFKAFAADYERQGLGTEHGLRWLARFRHENGLIQTGAMVEIKTPGATRARLLVNRRLFPQWLAAQSRAA